MNERIRELKDRCWLDKQWDKENERWIERHIDLEKFAELIVRECCVTADANIDDSKYPSYWIKRKFGVEE